MCSENAFTFEPRLREDELGVKIILLYLKFILIDKINFFYEEQYALLLQQILTERRLTVLKTVAWVKNCGAFLRHKKIFILKSFISLVFIKLLKT